MGGSPQTWATPNIITHRNINIHNIVTWSMRYLNFCQWVKDPRHDFRNLRNTHYNKYELNNSIDVTYPLEYVFLSIGL